MKIISVRLPPPVYIMRSRTKSYSLSDPYLEDKSINQKSKSNLICKLKSPENDSRNAVFEAVHKVVLTCHTGMLSACQVRNDAF